jgi:hypothetical protein
MGNKVILRLVCWLIRSHSYPYPPSIVYECLSGNHGMKGTILAVRVLTIAYQVLRITWEEYAILDTQYAISLGNCRWITVAW